MPYDPERRHRRSIRLKGYDYTQPGAYFVTLCTLNRQCLFGEVVDGQMRLNEAGHVAQRCWADIPNHFPHVQLDAFIVMPNHVHGVLVIAHHVVGAKNFSPLPFPSSPLPLHHIRPYHSHFRPLPLPPHSPPPSPFSPLDPPPLHASPLRGTSKNHRFGDSRI
ncbi:MAG: hypothetical protein KatS3mg077_2495 [Candidatus Binatia bacterium]|nr:MAG: hypothetical protein KatS3mg077_2495 [Candidatus Binatia bacterium]